MTYRRVIVALCLLAWSAWPQQLAAFCGFYVAKADTDLFNKASKVVIARHEDRTVMTMANDFQGDLTEFAIVIPVPEVLERGQINVAEPSLLDHLDAYTAPRLVEYFDPDPCPRVMEGAPQLMRSAVPSPPMADLVMEEAAQLGVTIEAEYTVGEYDILILSAKESDGLATWLTQNDYRIPTGAEAVLESYIKQDMRFFVAKVNLEEQSRLGFSYLRPIQVAYESSRFMLPVRLGTMNADGNQEIFIFTLTRLGRVEPTNYRQVKIPSNQEIPLYVKDAFGEFYTAMFDQQATAHDNEVIFLEYAWDMNWCDPCAADPLSVSQLRDLGVFWLPKETSDNGEYQIAQAGERTIMPSPPLPPTVRMPGKSDARDVFVTRMHARYNAESFPDDIFFKETPDRHNFQGRYVLRHPWKNEAECEQADAYYSELPDRFEKEAQTLANMTGWDIAEIRDQMEANGQSFTPYKNRKGTKKPESGTEEPKTKWWETLWD